jgi:hypothetical protein
LIETPRSSTQKKRGSREIEGLRLQRTGDRLQQRQRAKAKQNPTAEGRPEEYKAKKLSPTAKIFDR